MIIAGDLSIEVTEISAETVSTTVVTGEEDTDARKLGCEINLPFPPPPLAFPRSASLSLPFFVII
jgi:hypothetical protein